MRDDLAEPDEPRLAQLQPDDIDLALALRVDVVDDDLTPADVAELGAN